ncbi:hypothetical protein F5Y18DRAFT_428582 [Xylariaceae sp. FL1019]|nr:hypothetical protein F5Y18DRAFT_428582 [Xylariaceae sp. FL1019]
MASSNDQENTIYRTLCFYAPPNDGADPQYFAETATVPGKRNYPHDRAVVPITDIRGQEDSFALDQHSFAALPGAFTLAVDFNNVEDIVGKYLPWLEHFLVGFIPNAAHAKVFDYKLRKASAMKTANRQVHKIHIDQSPAGAFGRVRRHLSDEHREAIENGEADFRIVNVWKPLFNQVSDHPLAFAEFRSLQTDDLVPVRQIYADYVGETLAVRFREGQVFRYWSGMTPSDMLLLQCFDSQEQPQEVVVSGALRHCQCAHGCFRLLEEDEPCTRESIEVRCLVVMDKPRDVEEAHAV